MRSLGRVSQMGAAHPKLGSGRQSIGHSGLCLGRGRPLAPGLPLLRVYVKAVNSGGLSCDVREKIILRKVS